MPHGLKDGTVVYRNQDQQMESVLAGQTSRRFLPLSWLLEETQNGFRLTVRQGERTAYQDFECEHQEARTDQTASIRDILSKLGGTIYETMDTEIAFSGPWFIPRSRLAEWRREVLTMLEEQQTLPLTPSQERGVVTTDLCPHQQNIILPPLVGERGLLKKHQVCFCASGGEHSPVRRADRLGRGPLLFLIKK
jgi:hypothetical protein